MATTITFGGNSLQTSTILTDNIADQSMPTIDAKQYPLSHANQSKIPYISYPNKIFQVSGTLIGGTITGLDTLLDTFKGYCNIGADGTLSIGNDNTTRNYTATVTKCEITRPYGLTYAKFQIEFTCDSPWGVAATLSTAWSIVGHTVATATATYAFTGSAPYQYPILTITMSTVTAATTAVGAVTFGNTATGQAITIPANAHTWLNGDVAVIDSTQNIVTVNGANTNFFGAFPFFTATIGTLYYTDTFTKRNNAINVTYTPAYL